MSPNLSLLRKFVSPMYREYHCDVIVAIGVGSPKDCGKAIGIVFARRPGHQRPRA